LPLAVAIGLTACFVILFLFDPRQYGFYPQCPLYSLTGLHCPGCGALRGLHELLHGHMLVAVRMNSLLFFGLPALGGVYLYQRLLNKRVATAPVLQIPFFVWCALVVVVLFGILRNVPVYPFTLLAP